MLPIRTGTILIGPPMIGKSSVINALKNATNAITKNYIEQYKSIKNLEEENSKPLLIPKALRLEDIAE